MHLDQVTLVLPQSDYAALLAAALRGIAWRSGAAATAVLLSNVTVFQPAALDAATGAALMPGASSLTVVRWEGWHWLGTNVTFEPVTPLPACYQLPDLMHTLPSGCRSDSSESSRRQINVAVGVGIGVGVGCALLLACCWLAVAIAVVRRKAVQGALWWVPRGRCCVPHCRCSTIHRCTTIHHASDTLSSACCCCTTCRQAEEKEVAVNDKAASILPPDTPRRTSKLSVLGVAVPGSIVALLTPQQTQQSIGSSRSRSRSVSRQLFRVSDADPEAGQVDADAQFALGSTTLATLGEAIMFLTPGQCRLCHGCDASIMQRCSCCAICTLALHHRQLSVPWFET
jgi:hypothetical protein